MKKIEDYLHLYIGCEFVIESISERFQAHTTSKPTDVRVLTSTILYLVQEGDIAIKPILRRLSSMTEEEMNECWFNMPGPVEVRCEYKDGGVKKFDATPEQVLYLLSKGFDLFGLIDAGLAIDAATV